MKGRRRVAAVVVLSGLSVAMSILVLQGRGGTKPLRPAPFDPGALRAFNASGAAAEVPVPAVLLYVDDACPYCAKELALWKDVLQLESGGTPPVVVTSPGSDPHGLHVPEVLRKALLHDRDGAIGRALGVRAVPYRAIIGQEGTVVAQHTGLSPRDEVVRLLSPSQSKESKR